MYNRCFYGCERAELVFYEGDYSLLFASDRY